MVLNPGFRSQVPTLSYFLLHFNPPVMRAYKSRKPQKSHRRNPEILDAAGVHPPSSILEEWEERAPSFQIRFEGFLAGFGVEGLGFRGFYGG